MHFTARQLADAYRARFIINVLYQAGGCHENY
jgi:hypothetical protein